MFDTALLNSNKEVQERYKEKVAQKLEHVEEKNWSQIKSAMVESAKEVIGYRDNSNGKKKISKEVEELSMQQKELRLAINNSTNVSYIKQKKNERNKIMKSIKKKIKEEKEREIDKLAHEIEHSNQSVAMFQAVKKIRNTRDIGNIVVHDKKGEIVISKKKQYEEIKNHFHMQFNNPSHIPIEKYDGEARPLNKPISIVEVKQALKKLKCNKATGEDGIPGELLKHLSEETQEFLATIYNEILKHTRRI